MQFLSAVLALAATASAATLVPRQQAFFVKGFKAACVPHSVRCQYSFNITSDPQLFPEGTRCEATLNGPDKLPAVTQQPCDNTWKFDVKPQDGGLYLAAFLPINSRVNQDYCHKIPADQLVVDDNGAVQTQRYNGPTDFQVSIFECDRS
ncbi:hypothetical protein PpBr36_00071 [Pyricularia pennisetigena]|uniref:hypothetical protein n=1 Tax=Pyricularia pennisetigena TaxID=1578925 RepID=UPI001153958C|nr:hypothetical protein PpBr36_00071 [Pyricularia pennisetigena]TLS28085.1 hypothetical protein PpBr36_00071 [Pyricularia pennisetigena]